MRFRVGPIPEPLDFDPDAEGWKSIREPDPMMMQLVALPVLAITAAAVWLFLLYATTTQISDLWKWILPVFPFVIVVHELVHAIVHPGHGRLRDSILGVWPSRLLFYAHYDAALTRNRFVAILAAPFVVLTIVPLALLSLTRIDSPFVAAIAAANAVGACGDLLGILLLGFQIPTRALVRNKGWRSYWKPTASR